MKYQEFKHLKREQVDRLREIFGENGQFADYLAQPDSVTKFKTDLKNALIHGRHYSISDLVHHHNRIPLEEVNEVERFAYERLDQLATVGEINGNERQLYGKFVQQALEPIRGHVTLGDFIRVTRENEERQARRIIERLFGKPGSSESSA